MSTTFAGFERAQHRRVPVLHRRDDRCKTFRISLLWQRPLAGGQAARALLPAVLQHGTARYPDRPALARAREQLYGVATGFGLGRHGETSVLRLAADAVAGDFLPGRPDQFGAVLALLQEQLLQPRLHGAALPPDVFARERDQALAAARAVFENKGQWARQRAIEAACRDEPYGVPEHGGEAAIARLTAAEPVQALDDFLRRGKPVVLATGVLPEDPLAALEPLLAALPAGDVGDLPPPVEPPPRPVVRVRERAPMQQARLGLVFRSPPGGSPAGLCARQVLLSLWGGGPHSRLFREVRERRSLCYQIGTAGDADKGLVLVQAGGNADAIPAIVGEVTAQLAEIAAARFSAEELATAIAQCQAPLRSIDDAPAARLAYTADQWLRGVDRDPTAWLAGLGDVDAGAVAAAAAALRFDCDYALVPEDIA